MFANAGAADFRNTGNTEGRLQLLLDSIEDDAICMLDPAARVVTWNRGAEIVTGYAAGEALGRRYGTLFVPEEIDGNVCDAKLAEAARRGRSAGEGWRLRKNGERFWASFAITAIRDGGGKLTGFATVTRDFSEVKRRQDALLQMAHHDPLTGLPNRGLLHDRIGQAIERARRFGGKVAVFMVDLDSFKRINDTFGHATGDGVLVTVGVRLRAAVRATDSVIRMGGDEFVVVMPDISAQQDILSCAEKILDTLQQPMEVGARSLRTACCVGFAVFPDEAQTVQELLSLADAAMYAAKRNGKNQCATFDRAFHLAAVAHAPHMAG